MKKILILLFFIFGISFAEDIEKLLEEYEKAETLKTVEEESGTVIVFSRKDIERLQLYTVADILKLIPVGTFYPNNFGTGHFVFSGESSQSIKYTIRLYLDGHELSSIHTSDPFLTYDYFPLDNIDKVEVYLMLGFSSNSVEDGIVLIKMYSKDPKKENISVLRTTVDTKNSYTISFSDARQISAETSYFVMASISDLNFEKQLNNLDRDQKRKHFYFKFNYLDTSIQLSASDVKRNLFAGLSSDFSPDFVKGRSTDVFISLTQKLLEDKSLEILFSYDYQKRNYEESNKDYGVPFLPYVNQNGVPIYLKDERSFIKNIFNVNKDFKFNKNFINFGLIYQSYQQRAEGKKLIYPSNIVVENYEPEYTEEAKLFSGYLDYIYKKSKNLKFNLNTKYSYFSWSNNKDREVLNLKVGISYKIKNYNLKTYLSRLYIPPPFIYIEMSNKELKPTRYDNFFIENKFNFKNSNILFDFNYNEAYDLIIPTSNGYINYNKKVKSYSYLLQYFYEFKNLNFKLQGWINDIKNIEKLSPTKGINIILSGKTLNIDYFAEVLYRDKFEAFGTKVDEAVDLTLGASYKFKNGFYLKIKGENLLNKAPKAFSITPLNKGTYGSLDKRFYITLEKVF